MIFSTIPTAAAVSSPRLFAIIVIIIKAIWINPSCSATGIPIFNNRFIVFLSILKSFLEREIPVFFFIITTRAISTLIVCEQVVPNAAPAAPICSPPIKR